MGVIDRIATILRANLNDLLSRAEDPEKILNQTLMDMRQAQYDARMQVAEAIAEGKKLRRDVAEQTAEAEAWGSKAEQALGAGREDLAREALRRRRAGRDLAAALGEQAEKHDAAVEGLKSQLRALDAKIDQAERKRRLLLARQKRGEAERSVADAMARTDTRDALQAFDRIEGRIERGEDRLRAEQELRRDLSLEEEFAALEGEPDIEAELGELRRRLQPADDA